MVRFSVLNLLDALTACKAILTSFNRNFKGRNDGNVKTMNFLASPDLVTAMAFSGKLTFNPLKDELIDSEGRPFRFQPPTAPELPSRGFIAGDTSFLPRESPEPDASVDIVISPTSTRLERLEPFAPHFTQQQIDSGEPLEIKDLKCLFRVRGVRSNSVVSARQAHHPLRNAQRTRSLQQVHGYAIRVISIHRCAVPD